MSNFDPTNQAIAVYDSGLGGLSVLRALYDQLPNERYIYFGDQAHVPYGDRGLDELRVLAENVTRFFIRENAKIIVIACNTASAAALKYLRQIYPEQIFVGMEPAVKPAAEQSHSHKVGVLATPSTFHGELYASVVERFASNVEIFKSTCPGLVAQIEKGELNSPETKHILHEAIDPMLAEGIDRLVLACTHFPFVIPAIEEILDGKAAVIDPSPAIARQTARSLNQRQLLSKSDIPLGTTFYTSGEADKMQALLKKLIGIDSTVEKLDWLNGKLLKKA